MCLKAKDYQQAAGSWGEELLWLTVLGETITADGLIWTSGLQMFAFRLLHVLLLLWQLRSFHISWPFCSQKRLAPDAPIKLLLFSQHCALPSPTGQGCSTLWPSSESHMGHCVPVISFLALVHPAFCPRLPLFSAIFGSNDSCPCDLQFLSICPLCEMSWPVFAQHIGLYTRSPKVFSSQPCSYLSLWRHSAWQFTASSLGPCLPLVFEVLR